MKIHLEWSGRPQDAPKITDEHGKPVHCTRVLIEFKAMEAPRIEVDLVEVGAVSLREVLMRLDSVYEHPRT